jgi:hypothetical protein
MKAILVSTVFVFLLLQSAKGFAQDRKRPGMPEEGYWVIESNIKSPRQCTVYCYTNEHLLIYKEGFTGKKLNPAHPRVVRRMNALLHQAVLAWRNDHGTEPVLVKTDQTGETGGGKDHQ